MIGAARSRKTKRNASHLRSADLAEELCKVGRTFYSRGWAPGTAGNYSAVLNLEPLTLLVTPSGADKGNLVPSQIIEVNHKGEVVRGKYPPSYETLVHLAIVQARAARAVLHTHSVWATVLSDAYARSAGITMEGYEVLKGLEGVKTHQHKEWVPILENCQDMSQLARTVTLTLGENPGAHGFLLHKHGLYTWGRTLQEAARHIEIFEFLFEAMGRIGPGAAVQ